MCTQRNISELVHSAVSVQTGKYTKYIKYKSKSNYTAYLLIINPACLDLKENSTPGLSLLLYYDIQPIKAVFCAINFTF